MQTTLRTGTDNVPFQVPTLNTPTSSGMPSAMLSNSMPSGGMTQPDYGTMATPSVWRHRDRTQAAAKVDALASGGMDDFEIPAFLRKQAD
jgi:cell division protein FtsZ